MKNSNRRDFLKTTLAAGSALLIARVSHAQDVVSEDDPTAVALGYKADHTTVDVATYAKKAGPDGADQRCTTCSLYQPVDEEYGNCPIFAGKLVHANGWCNSWVG
jgi:hypothetical protein